MTPLLCHNLANAAAWDWYQIAIAISLLLIGAVGTPFCISNANFAIKTRVRYYDATMWFFFALHTATAFALGIFMMAMWVWGTFFGC